MKGGERKKKTGKKATKKGEEYTKAIKWRW